MLHLGKDGMMNRKSVEISAYLLLLLTCCFVASCGGGSSSSNNSGEPSVRDDDRSASSWDAMISDESEWE